MILEVEGIHCFYGLSHVLHGVSLDLAAGEIVSLLGRNGAGKTTTIQAIMGLVKARSGINLASKSLPSPDCRHTKSVDAASDGSRKDADSSRI